jgi:hypothetical protein
MLSLRCPLSAEEVSVTIRLQTSKRPDIPNEQFSELSAFERNWTAELPKKHPDASIGERLSPMYDCHGLAFASRRTRIWDVRFIQRILADDDFREVPREQVIGGGSRDASGLAASRTERNVCDCTPNADQRSM